MGIRKRSSPMSWVTIGIIACFQAFILKTNAKKVEEDRIVGGTKVKPHTIPWQALYIRKYKTTGDLSVSCGGVIICPKFVLTAGHCTQRFPAEDAQIVVGIHNLKEKEASITRHDITKYHDHESFLDIDEEYSQYDYSILELAEPISIRKEARPIFLPTTSNFGPDAKFLVSGWGRLAPREVPIYPAFPRELMSVTVPWVSDQDCKDAYKEPKPKGNGWVKYVIDETMICAGDKLFGKIDACNGDSGGPMAWLNPKTGHVEIIGLVSFGYSCARANAPGVYAKLTTVLDWINSITGGCNAETCSAKKCMTKALLDRTIIARFQHVTPHHFLKQKFRN